ncbi:MAG: hypothetical protein ACK4J0_01765 [Candidatus Anstonellaceae archaeon]
MQEILIGKLANYYSKIGVGVLDLEADLAIGDKIRIERPSGSFIQKVQSIQMEHQPQQSALAGQSIGIKLDQPAPKGSKVYKIIEE